MDHGLDRFPHPKPSRAANDGPGDLPLIRGIAAPHRRQDGCAHFDIFATDCVSFTSTLRGGGDWHWRLTSPSGKVLAECGGFRSQIACMRAVDALRAEAGGAIVVEPPETPDPMLRNLQPLGPMQ